MTISLIRTAEFNSVSYYIYISAESPSREVSDPDPLSALAIL